MATVIRSPRVEGTKRVGTSAQPVLIEEPEIDTVEEELSIEPSMLASEAPLPASDPVEPEVEVERHDAVTVESDESELKEELEKLTVRLQHALERAGKAEQGLERLESELDALKDQAKLSGHEEGYRSGQEEGRASFEENAHGLVQLIESIQAQSHSLLAGSEDQMVEIIYAAVIKILGDALITKSGVQASIRQVIAQVSQRGDLMIRVAPRDHTLLKSLFADRSEDQKSSRVEIISDDRVELGGCILETTGGSLDGRLELQLQILKETLLSVRAQGNADVEEFAQ